MLLMKPRQKFKMTPYEARRHTHFPRKESSGPGFFEDFRAGVRKRQQQAIYGNRPADPLSFLSQGGALASMITKGLSQLTGAEELSKGNPTGAALAAMFGPAAMLRGAVQKGALQLLPANPFGKNIAGDAFSELLRLTGRGLKKVAAPAAGALAALPTEAEGGYARVLQYLPSLTRVMREGIDSVRPFLNNTEKQILKLLDEGVPTKLRHVDHKRGQRMPEEISKEEKRLFRGLDELFPRGPGRFNTKGSLIHPNYREHLINLFNRGYKVDDILNVARMHGVGRTASRRQLREAGKKPPGSQYDLFETSPPVTASPKGPYRFRDDFVPASSRRPLPLTLFPPPKKVP